MFYQHFCLWAYKSVAGLPFIAAAGTHVEGWVCLSADGSRILLDEKDILDVTREVFCPKPHVMGDLRHREVAGLPSVSLLADGRFACVLLYLGCQRRGVCHCSPAPVAGSSPSPVRQTLVPDSPTGFVPCDETISPPCTAPCLLPPLESVFPHYNGCGYWKAQRGGGWSPLATCKEQGIQTASWEPFGNVFFFFTLSYLVSYLFLCALFWNWGRDLKHKYPSGEVAETLRSGPLGLAVPPVHRRQQVAALPLWAHEPHLWFEDLSVALLCSLALGEIANSSVVRSWYSSPGISHMFAHSFFPLCLLNGFLLSILTPT